MIKHNKTTKQKRQTRVRQRLLVGSSRPRLTVSRSNEHMYAQILEPLTGKVLASASDLGIKAAKQESKTAKASQVGQLLAKKALANKVSKVYFDRGFYKYHGRVKALAEAARNNGLEF